MQGQLYNVFWVLEYKQKVKKSYLKRFVNTLTIYWQKPKD